MDIKELIPQREPFLFIDKIIEFEDDKLTTQITFNDRFDFFKGHFPARPVVPGVILSEHCFQSGAALMATLHKKSLSDKIAVVSRIKNCKFKQLCSINDVITTSTELIESMEDAFYLRSIGKNQDGKKVIIIDYVCNLIEE